MYRVWFEGFIDRYYKDFEKAYEACQEFILNSCYSFNVKQEMLQALAFADKCELCGFTKIKFEDEFDEFAPKVGKTKYTVTFTKYETVEVEAYNEREAEELADEILSADADAWEGPADEITVELVEY